MDERDKFFVIPKSTALEREVIGEIMLEPDQIKKQDIRPEHFTPKFQPIYQAIRKAYDERGAVSLAILVNYLPGKENNIFFERASLTASGVFTAVNLIIHAEMLREWEEKRRLHSIFVRAVEGLYQGTIQDVLIPIKAFQEGRSGTNLSASMKRAILTAEEIAGKDFPDRPKILDPWLPEASITMIAGPAGIGKSCLAMGLLEAITRGSNFGPWETKAAVNCFLIDGEMTVQDTQGRIKTEGHLEALRPGGFLIYSDHWATQLNLPKINILKEDFRNSIIEICKDYEVKLLVLDNLSAMTPGIDENLKMDWDVINQWLLELRFAGISTIFIHHVGKSGQQRGTSARIDSIDTAIILSRPEDYQPEDGARFVAKFEKCRVLMDDRTKIADMDFKFESIRGQGQWTWKPVRKEKVEQVRELLAEGVPVKDIVEITGLSRAYVYRIKADQDKEKE